MHSYYDISKEVTKTDCRTMGFYNKGFSDLKCGLVGGNEVRCKNVRRVVVEPKDVGMNKNEAQVDIGSVSLPLLEDVADYTCLGSDMSQYILNEPFINKVDSRYGNSRLGFALTQCLGIRNPKNPDYAYDMQSDENFVSYNTKTGKAVWSTHTQGLGTKGDYSILFRNDGHLVIYNKTSAATWGSRSFHGSPDALRVKVVVWQFHDGHMYLSNMQGRSAWASTAAKTHSDIQIQAKNQYGTPSGYCLDFRLSGGTEKSGGVTYLNKCNGNGGQLWNIYTDGTIQSRFGGLCLASPFTGNEQKVYVNPCDKKTTPDLWQVRGDGTIMSRFANKCLNNRGQLLAKENQIQVYDCINAWSEKW